MFDARGKVDPFEEFEKRRNETVKLHKGKRASGNGYMDRGHAINLKQTANQMTSIASNGTPPQKKKNQKNKYEKRPSICDLI